MSHPKFRTSGRRALLSALGLGAALALSPGGAPAQQPAPVPGAPAGVQVDTVLVRGNQRVDAEGIRVISALPTDRLVTAVDIQNGIRRLMGTGNFDAVEILSQEQPGGGAALVIQVEERPLVARTDFLGLERISGASVRDTLGLAPNQPLNPQTVTETFQMIRDLLAAEGVQVAEIDTTTTAAGDSLGSVVLTYRVREGNRLAIADIQFEGNVAFDDAALRGAMATKPEGFLWFRNGRYDPDRFEEDLRQNLPDFYGQNGYIDFAVVSDTMLVDPRTGKARLVVTVEEGPQYRLGEFAIEGATRFPTEQLERMFTAQRRSVLGLPFGRDDQEQGEVFDYASLRAATERVQQLYRNEGYLYAQVEPIIERDTANGAAPTVDVTWAVSEQSPFYVNRVTINGNTYTHESVIRDRLVVYPGDVYSEDRLLQSYRSIAALGFFETPLPTPDIRPDPEAGTVDIVFSVTEKQTGSINFGTAIGGGYYGQSGGISGFLGYSQPNLFGQAKQADLRVEYGYGRSSATASYTDPSLFGSRNSMSVSLFHTDDRYRNVSFSDGRYLRTGGSLRFGVPVPGMRFTRAFAGYSLSRYRYEARDADDCEENFFCQPSSLASTLSLGLTRDTKDHPLFPSAGTRQNLGLEQVGGVLGGDGNFQRATAELEWWTPVGRIGGGEPGSRPIIFTFGLAARSGAVFGDAERFPLNRFFLGGTQYGQPLRGYDEFTITPFGHRPTGAPGVSSNDRLGDAFLAFTAEYAIRLNDNFSFSAFADAGNIWNEPAAVDPTRLLRSAGVGATIVTPFGPLGIDWAYGFDRLDERGQPAPGWKFHFKINQPGF